MKAKFLLMSFILTSLIFVQPLDVHAEEKSYDPQHTVLALNMAIVSIHRILSTNDRAILDTEYRNIINNLKLGSIESDNEIISLYQELMNAISNKTLNLEAAKKLQANYDAWAEQHITRSVSGASGIIQGIGGKYCGKSRIRSRRRRTRKNFRLIPASRNSNNRRSCSCLMRVGILRPPERKT